MGSCSLKGQAVNENGIKVILISPNIPTTVEEEKKEDPNLLNPRSSKLKQKAALQEVRKGSVPITDAPTAQVRSAPKSSREISLIERSFERHFIFNTLSHDQKSQIIECMKQYTLAPNQVIFRQNQPGNNFFIVGSGMLEVLINEQRITTLTEGMGFGELALMHDTPRTATVRTLTSALLWGLDRGTFKQIIEDLNAKNYQENKNFIQSVSVFATLRPEQIEVLVGSMRTLNFVPGQVIVKEGDIGDLLFIIKDGAVSCTRGGAEIKRFVKGEYFGEQALLHNSPRTATCIAVNNLICLSIDGESLTNALGSQLQTIIFKNSEMITIEKNLELSKLAQGQTELLINSMEVKGFKAGEVVITKGTMRKNCLVMVLKGELIVDGEVFEKFQCLAVEDIINNSDRVYESNVLCNREADLALISKEAFENVIGGEFNSVTSGNEAFKVLKKVQILRDLNDDKLHALISSMKIVKFATKDIIVQQNSPGDSFYIVKSGKVSVKIDGHEVRTITKHDYFGERSVIFNQVRTATVIATEPVECWVLFQVDFLRIIDQGLRYQLLKRIELQDDSISLDDLTIVKPLGKGMFGNVFLVAHKVKKVLYALKTVDRRKIDAYELHESLILERKVLLQLDHIFIMKLVKTLKDEKRIYFVLEYVKGMDLFDALRKMNEVSESDSRFFIGCLIVIFQHLHDRDILYRDLKPENIVVDDEGYLRLIDFGTAKIVNGRTYTIVGTPHYMAPEVILRKGYGVSADYWSLGILLYELLYERVPFADEEEDPMIIYEVVLTGKLRYPRRQSPHVEVKSVINQLLNKNPSIRMAGGFEALKQHIWFSTFDWELLLSKTILAPYIPKVNHLNIEKIVSISNRKSLDSVISSDENDVLPNIGAKAPLKWDKDF